jgi:hypothetical protein
VRPRKLAVRHAAEDQRQGRQKGRGCERLTTGNKCFSVCPFLFLFRDLSFDFGIFCRKKLNISTQNFPSYSKNDHTVGFNNDYLFAQI